MTITHTIVSFLSLFLHFHSVLSHGMRSHQGKHSSDRHLQHNGGCGYVPPSDEDNKLINEDLAMFLEYIGGKEGLKASRKADVTINTYFHVISKSDGTGDLDDSVIEKQMQILNDAFGGVQSNYTECDGFSYGDQPPSPFRFNLVETIRTVDDYAFDLDSSSSERVRADLRRGSCSDLNIYSGTTYYLGFASLPYYCDDYASDDAVIINVMSVPDGGGDFSYEGDTLVHEVGHWLGLEHTFHTPRGNGICRLFSEVILGRSTHTCQNGEDIGDSVVDTPAQDGPTFGCPVGRDSCPNDPGFDPIHNYMDYSDDCCMYRFTQGQIDRMLLQVGQYRGIPV